MPPSTAVMQGTKLIRPYQRFEGHTHWVMDVTYVPREQRIVTHSEDGSLRVWDLQTGELIWHWRNRKSSARVIALSPDGKKIVSGSLDGTVRLWDIDTGNVIAKWTGHAKNVASMYWNRSGERIVSGSIDGTVRVWDVESGKTVLEIETGLGYMWAAIYSPDTTKIATGGDSIEKEFIKIWDAKTGKLTKVLTGHREKVSCLAWIPDGRTLISGSNDCSIRTWDTTTWQQIAVLKGHTGYVLGIAISPDGLNIASASWDSTARLWNRESGQPIGSPLQHVSSVPCVSFSTDGKLLATGCFDCKAYTWDISVIVRENPRIGDNELLLNPNDGDKSFLDVDATRCPGQPEPTRLENVCKLHPDFFDDSTHHPNPSITRPISPSSARRNTLTRARPRNPFFKWPFTRNNQGIGLQERRTTVVDVPLGQGNPRYYSAGEARIKRQRQEAIDAKKKKDAKNTKNTSASSSWSPQSMVTKRSAWARQPAVSPSTPAATTSKTSPPDERAGRWSRLWPLLCCTSAHGHH